MAIAVMMLRMGVKTACAEVQVRTKGSIALNAGSAWTVPSSSVLRFPTKKQTIWGLPSFLFLLYRDSGLKVTER